IETFAGKYKFLYMLKISNSNSDEIRVFRKVFEHTGKLVCAKKTLMKLALNNYLSNKLGDKVEEFLSDSKGLQCGILFTDLDSKDVLEAISNFGSQNYAQVGEVSTKAIEISNEDLEHFPSSIQPYLEKIGVEVEVNN
ncbi:MAG: mRNA turnover 4, partial [Paramarteilia canceri]